MKILTIIGARPQFIKAASLSREIKKRNDIDEIIVHTGQHFDANMSDVFFDEMQIPKPHYNLDINSLNHGTMTGRMMEEIEKILLTENPDWLLVYGDTNSTLAGALAAKKLHIKVAHVEAGLRSFNMKMPEEVNRILTDRISDVLFCPTQQAVENLINEGFKNFNSLVVNVGDIMFDSALFYEDLACQPKGLIPENFILTTIHRAENTDDKVKLAHIFKELDRINQTVPVIIPLHPRTKKKLKEYQIKTEVNIINPLGYLEMVWLIKNSNAIITDSGGLQKEAYFFKKQCFTLRDQTEWVELLQDGCNQLINVGNDEIATIILNDYVADFDFSKKIYGEGNTSERILEILLEN